MEKKEEEGKKSQKELLTNMAIRVVVLVMSCSVVKYVNSAVFVCCFPSHGLSEKLCAGKKKECLLGGRKMDD